MNKFITKVAKLVLGLSLAAGVGVAVGSQSKASRVDAEDVTDTLVASSFAATNTTYTDFSGVSFTSNAVYAGNNGKTSSGGIQLRSKNSNSGIVTTTSGGTLKSISITVESGSNTVDIYGKTSAYSSASDLYSNSTQGTKIGNASTSGSVTLTNPSNYTYVGIRSNSGALYLTNITITWTVASNKLGTPHPVFNRSDNTITWESVSNATSYQLKVDSGSYATATSGYSVASLSVNDSHTVSVKALANGYTTSEEGTVTFKRFATKGTQADPFTVADARRFIDTLGGATSDDVYVSGIISQVDSYNSTYHSITYWISDDGTTSNQIEVYSGKGLNNTDFSAVTDVVEGAEVTVLGKVKLYSSTYEFDKNNYLTSYSYTPPAVTHTVSFNSNGGSNSPTSETVGDGLTFTFPSAGTKTNYVFKGWSSDSTTFYQENDHSGAITGDVSFTAYWQTKGTPADRYSVSEARAAITANTGIRGVEVSATISQVGNFDSTTKGITYYISDDGTTTNQLEVFKGKGISGADFAAASDIEVGANVVVHGNLKLYNTTYEFDSGNYQVSYSVPAVPSVSITNSSFSMHVGDSDVTLTATTENAGGASVVWTSSDTGVATIVDSNKVHAVAAGSSTITATITVDAVNYTDTITVTVTNAPVSIDADGTYTKVTSVSSLANNDVVLITNVDGDVAMSTTQNDNNRGVTSSNIDSGEITISGTTSIQAFALEIGTLNANTVYSFNTGSGYLYAASSSKNYLRTEDTLDDNGKFTISIDAEGVATITAQGSNTHNLLQYNSSNSIFSCYANAQHDVSIFKKSSTPVDPTKPISVTLSHATATVGVGGDVVLEATVNPSATAIPNTATWISDDTSVATVSNGTVHGVAAGTATITAFADEDGDGVLDSGEKYASCTVTVVSVSYGFFYQVTDESDLSASDKVVIVAHAGDSYEIMTTTASSNKMPAKVIDSSSKWSDTFGGSSIKSIRYNTETTLWTLGGNSSGWTFYNGSEYLHNGGSSSTNLNTNATASTFTLTDGSYGTFRMIGATRAVSFKADTSVFGHYAVGNIDGSTYYDVEIYKLVESVTSLGSLTCTGSGSYTGDWSSLSTTFSGLSLGEKAYYKHATYTASGSGDGTTVTATNGTDSTVAQFVAKYDYIVAKYGTTSNPDFIGRNPTPLGNSKVLLANVIGENTNTVAIIVVISMVSVTAIGGYFFLKKRREQN